MHEFRVHQAVQITSGKYTGAGATVLALRPATRMVQVQISGVINGEAVNASPWVKATALEPQP